MAGVNRALTCLFAFSLGVSCASAQTLALNVLAGKKPLLDAHNCYPYDGRWPDRVLRALRVGTPVAIEQDLAWGTPGGVVVSHKAETDGSEPTLEAHFFERVRPLMEKALREGDRRNWPLIVVHFDFKDNREPLLEAVSQLLIKYESWITTSKKGEDPGKIEALQMKPLLVLTEDPDAQQRVFFDKVPAGAPLRIFGSAHTNIPKGKDRAETEHLLATIAPEQLLTEPANNYRRWWNNSWHDVEEGGQRQAGCGRLADDTRLQSLVKRAHQLGYWIRFYTLDGFDSARGKENGWFESYNFGTLDAVKERWAAARAAGVDMIATDQYENLADWLKKE